jgi:hypothetical protein
MVNRDDKTETLNGSESTRKSSIPALVGTSAILLASVVACDINVGAQLGLAISETATINSQACATVESQGDDSDGGKKKTLSNRYRPYLKNAAGETFYDSDAEDDAYYYGDWDLDDYDDEEDFILW